MLDNSTAPITEASAELTGVGTVDNLDPADLPKDGVFTATISNPQASPRESESGAFGLVLPKGIGYSQVTVARSKRRPARFVGRMPDAQGYMSGIKGLRAALADAAGHRVPSYRFYNDALYGRDTNGPRGIIDGEVGFDRDTDQFTCPDLNWQRGAGVGGRFPQGFQTGIAGLRAALNAARYPRPNPGSPPPGFTASRDTLYNALITFQDGDLTTFSRKSALNSSRSSVQTGTSEPKQIKISIKARGGTFTGSFVHPNDASLPHPPVTLFNGVFQKIGATATGQGVFIGPNPATVTTSGSVLIIPQDSN